MASKNPSSSSAKELKEEHKTWTIRKIDPETIELVKEAANSKGMKVGAWVDSQLKAAAELSIGGENPFANELASAVDNVESKISQENAKRLEELSHNLDIVIKGQHSLFTLVAKIVENNSQPSDRVVSPISSNATGAGIPCES